MRLQDYLIIDISGWNQKMSSNSSHIVAAQREDKPETNNFKWVWLDMSSQTQHFCDFPQVRFGYLNLSGAVRLRIAQN